MVEGNLTVNCCLLLMHSSPFLTDFSETLLDNDVLAEQSHLNTDSSYLMSVSSLQLGDAGGDSESNDICLEIIQDTLNYEHTFTKMQLLMVCTLLRIKYY